MKPKDRAELHELAKAAGIEGGKKPAPPSYADFEHLQERIDRLENVLCDLATNEPDNIAIIREELKKALKDAGVIE